MIKNVEELKKQILEYKEDCDKFASCDKCLKCNETMFKTILDIIDENSEENEE